MAFNINLFERMFFMQIKKIISALLAGALITSSAVAVSAAELTDQNPDGSTEVYANILGSEPGEVSYVITIPESVDFGTLTQPETDTDSYKYLDFDVVATELNNLEARQAVSVFLKDSTADDGQFYLTQLDSETPFEISYDVYGNLVDDVNMSEYTPLNQSGDSGEYGYHLCTFTAGSQGTAQDVTLALNQKALYGQNLDDIAGDYSGTMVFHSALSTIGG